jgi:hypothetical protein
MPTPINIILPGITLSGELNDTPAAQALAQGLPFDWQASRWGEEYYGTTSSSFKDTGGETQTMMEVGDLAYHSGNGWLCLFFGPTPSSTGPMPEAAVPVFKVGTITGDWEKVSLLGPSIEAKVERE